MARIRTIKPDFFRHEELAEADSQTNLPLRLAFIGLWCCADREGRFRWKPKLLKLDVLPFDEVDFVQILNELQRFGFINKFEHEGEQYGYIPSWSKHQQVNIRESDSKIPDPSRCMHLPRHVHAPAKTCGEGEGERELEGELELEGKGKDITSILSDTCCPQASPEGPESQEKTKIENCPHQEIIEIWHTVMPECQRVKIWNEKRRVTLAARWRENPKHRDLDFWRKLFEHIRKSKFLMGKTEPRQDRHPFQISLDWIINPTNFANIIEGKYHR